MITCSYFDHVKYAAQEFLNRDKDIILNGVLKPTTDFGLSFPGGMVANVAAGTSWVDGFRIAYDASPVQSLTFAAADPTNPRIDLIEIGHTGSGATGAGIIQIVTGTPAGSPLQPQPDAGFIALFAIRVNAGVSSINSGNVTDLRIGISISGATNTPLASTTPAIISANSTGNTGTATTAARADHQHPTPATYPPTAHESSHLTGGSDPIPVATESADGLFSHTDKTKLDGVATGATNTPLSSGTPNMDGAANAGTSGSAARGDHVHPTDTSRAPLNSPALSGTPTAPTPTAGDNSTKISTTAFVAAALAALVASAPSTLDTLNELATALGDDPNFATTITNALAGKLSLTGGTVTGNLGIGGAPDTPLTIASIVANAIAFHLNNSGGVFLQLTDTGAKDWCIGILDGSNAITFFEDRYSGGAGTERVRIAAGGNVGIGESSPHSPLEISTSINGGSNSNNLTLTHYATNLGSPELLGKGSRGGNSVPTSVQSGDTVLQLSGSGYAGTSWSGRMAYIAFTAEENWTSTARGADIEFATTAAGGTSRTEKMRLTGAGYLGIGSTAPGGKLEIKGTRNGAQGQIRVIGDGDHAYIQVGTTTPTTKECGIQLIGGGTVNAPAWTMYVLENTTDIRLNSGGDKFVLDANGSGVFSGSVTGGQGIGAQTSNYVNALGGTASGIYLGWNYENGSGEGDIFVYGQGGTGGLSIYNTNSGAGGVQTRLLRINSDGTITGLKKTIPELYIPFFIGPTNIVTSITATSAGSTYQIPPRVLNSNWPTNTQYAFEVTLDADSGGTAYAALWDVTAGAVVAASQVSTTNTTASNVRSGLFSLTPGHTYITTGWTSNASYAAHVINATLIAFPI